MNIVGDAANEPSLVIDPTNPLRMAIGWRQFDTVTSNFRQAGWAYTTDGGATWTFPGVFTPGTFRSDPSLAADNAGRLFYNSLQQSFCMDVFLSTNGGATWPTSATAFGGDKNWIAVDRSGGIGDGNIYGIWQPGALCSSTPAGRLFTRSTNHGASFQAPVVLPNNPQFGVDAVGPDGTVYVGGINNGSQLFVVAKSTNAQNPAMTPSFTSVTGNFLGGTQAFGGAPNPGGLLGQVWIAANPTNASHVYLLCSVVPTGGGDPVDVRFSRSIDGGVTWSASKRVNDDSTTNGAYHWFGTMSVAPNGRIDVVWNDTRDDPANQLSRLYSTWSTDEGVTWSTNLAMTPQWNSVIGWPQQNKIGDYYHMISDNTYANLAYAATFNGEQDVYFMKYRPNDCNGNGIPDNQDIANGTSQDCNGNGLPDECESVRDCNHDGINDICELAGNDCNHNGIPDDCDAGHEDCNNNGILDQCEATFVDCNHNGHLDSCDIANGTSQDCNGNGVPDECELPSSAKAADVCGNALFITPGFTYTGSNSAATTDAGSGASCGTSGLDVYYRYRPITNGTLSLSLCAGTAFDTVMSLHTGCPGTTANQVSGACDDDGCGTGGGPSVINNIAVTKGTTYLIRISGWGSPAATGSFTLTITGPTGVGDCNNNGIPDTCEIANGEDANGNGIPDSCEPYPACATCQGDLNGDSLVNGADVQSFIACYLAFPTVLPSCGCADLNGNHQVNSTDVGLFVNKLLAGGCP